jgi:cytochrome c6
MNLQRSAFRFLLALLPQLASAAPPGLPGQAIFQQNCVRCHGANGKRGLNGAHDLTKSNLNEFGRTYLVTNGMGKMPAFDKKLTPAQVRQVVAYSLTLK